MDRRIKYTKILLKDALVELMQTQHISGISIKALCERADVNRSTFYAHYTDQYDLLHQLEQEVLENLKRYLEKPVLDNNLPISTQVLTLILEYLKDDAALFRALLSENCDIAIQKDIMELAQVVAYPIDAKMDDKLVAYIKEYGITGCISIVKKWLQEGTQEPPEVLSELMMQMTYYGLCSFQTPQSKSRNKSL